MTLRKKYHGLSRDKLGLGVFLLRPKASSVNLIKTFSEDQSSEIVKPNIVRFVGRCCRLRSCYTIDGPFTMMAYMYKGNIQKHILSKLSGHIEFRNASQWTYQYYYFGSSIAFFFQIWAPLVVEVCQPSLKQMFLFTFAKDNYQEWQSTATLNNRSWILKCINGNQLK